MTRHESAGSHCSGISPSRQVHGNTNGGLLGSDTRERKAAAADPDDKGLRSLVPNHCRPHRSGTGLVAMGRGGVSAEACGRIRRQVAAGIYLQQDRPPHELCADSHGKMTI